MIVDLNFPIAIILVSPTLMYIAYNIFLKKDRNYLKYIFIMIFSIYILGLSKYVIFPIFINSYIAQEVQETQTVYENLVKNMNLIPFFKGFNRKDFILNIIMTFPMGCLLPCLKGKKIKNIVLKSILIGLVFELNQLVLTFIQGFTFRNININDSIANALGIVLGYSIFSIFLLNFKKVFSKTKNRFLKYILVYFNEFE